VERLVREDVQKLEGKEVKAKINNWIFAVQKTVMYSD
jgi:hypothetical protein